MAVRAPTSGTRLHVRDTVRAPIGPTRITGKYLSVTSFRRDATGVATPVWFVSEGDRLLAMTAEGSGKVKRIRRNPSVTVAASSMRGRLHGTPIPAHAELMPSTEVERVKRLMGRKYRFDLLFIKPIRAIQSMIHPERRDEQTTIVEITPTSL
ncbi:MAG: PPOX class F420-dependent oxidoreductase [Actinomycetota bacterium]